MEENNETTIRALKNTIKTLEQASVIKDMEIFSLNERVSSLVAENKGYDTLFGFTEDMSMEDKIKYNEECEKEIEEAEASLDEDAKKEYYSELEKEDLLVKYALQINELQYETSELFLELKKGVGEKNYAEYKKHKRNFYAMIEIFYKIYEEEDKLYIFDILIEALRKQRRVYKLDDCLKNID